MDVFGILGVSFGTIGFVFALSALSQITKLKKELKDAGILDKKSKPK